MTSQVQSAQSGAVTLIQRFGSCLKPRICISMMLYLNGVYASKGYFWPVEATVA